MAAGTMKFQTKTFWVEILSPTKGYFEHEVEGDNCAGELIFDGKELIDYDGVFALPMEVVTALREYGWVVGEEFEP